MGLALFEFERRNLGLIEVSEPPRSGGVNAEILNAVIRRGHVVINAEEATVRRIARLYAMAARELAATIRDRFAAGIGAGRFSQALRGRQLGELARVLEVLAGSGEREVGRAMREIWAAQIETGVEVFEHAIPEDILAHISLVRPNPLLLDVTSTDVLGQSLSRWWDIAEARILDAVETQINLGSLQGLDMSQMISRIARLMNIERAKAEVFTRTAVQTASNEAQALLYNANRDILSGVEWTATLDRRTCPVCGSLDGRVWRFGKDYDSRPRPPAHPRCRCALSPVTKSWAELAGKKPSLQGAAPSARASMDGFVPEGVAYEKWLRGQPRAVIDDVLGKGRASRFAAGEPLSTFARHGSYRPNLGHLPDRLKKATRGLGAA